MKIITISLSNSKELRGGATRRYIELLNEFIQQGHEVHHISPKGFDNIINSNLYPHGTYMIPIPPSYLPFSIQVIPKVIYLANRYDIDVLVSFTIFDALIGIISRIFCRKMKVILCDRADSIKGMEIGFEKKIPRLSPVLISILNKLEKFIYQNVDFTIFNSLRRREEIIEKTGIKKENTVVIYNNANPSWILEKEEEANEKSKEIMDHFKDKKIICFIGNLYLEGRDIITLIKAFRIIKREIDDVILLIVGDGPDKERISNLIEEYGLNGSVFLEGWQNNPYSYMLASDLNVVTALHESFSNTILESIYFEKLIIGSDVGGIPEILEDKKLLFTAKDEDELANKCIDLLNNKTEHEYAEKMIKNRREFFVFDWNKKMTSFIEKITMNKL